MYNPGDRLRNGATLIAKDGDQVLCIWQGSEYAIWTIDDDGVTFWGRYFPKMEWKEAFQEFIRRTENGQTKA